MNGSGKGNPGVHGAGFQSKPQQYPGPKANSGGGFHGGKSRYQSNETPVRSLPHADKTR